MKPESAPDPVCYSFFHGSKLSLKLFDWNFEQLCFTFVICVFMMGKPRTKATKQLNLQLLLE